MTYYDYRFRFLAGGVALAVTLLTALRSTGFLGAGELPDNMLGDPLDATGKVVRNVGNAVFYGRRGRASSTYTDDNGHQQTEPAIGDPAYIYLHVRSGVSPAELGVNLADYGLESVSAAASSVVLGVWA